MKSVLLNGSETWKVTKKIPQRMKNMRHFLPGAPKQCETLYFDETGAYDICKRKWGWIGHTLRKHPANITRQALFWNPPGSRKPGRPSATWQSSIRKEAAQYGKQLNELAALASNRVRFKSFVDALHFTVK